MKSPVFIALILVISATFVSSIRISASGQAQLAVKTALASRYIGCFEDSPSRTMAPNYVQKGDMTIEWCAQNCLGYKYFGVEWASQCFCSDTLPPNLKDGCNKACNGNSSQTCGGDWALSVYTTPVPPSLPLPQYYDCYTDYPEPNRVFLPNKTSTDDNTIEKCARTCADFPYFGVQWSRECFCGRALPTSPKTTCDYTCTGNRSQICGGSWRISVYGTCPSDKDLLDYGLRKTVEDLYDADVFPSPYYELQKVNFLESGGRNATGSCSIRTNVDLFDCRGVAVNLGFVLNHTNIDNGNAISNVTYNIQNRALEVSIDQRRRTD